MDQRAIPAADVPQAPIRCPQCKTPDVILDGMVGRKLHEVRRNGEMVKEDSTVGDDMEMDITLLTCPACRIEFYVQNAYESRLANENFDLSIQLAESRGELKPINKLVC